MHQLETKRAPSQGGARRLDLLYTGIYALVALAVVAFAKGYRLRTFVVMLALGVVVNYCVSLAGFKRVAVVHLRATGSVSPDMYQGCVRLRDQRRLAPKGLPAASGPTVWAFPASGGERDRRTQGE